MRHNDGLLIGDAAPTLKGGASFSLRNRMYRVIWGVGWGLLASWTPPPFHRWRGFVLRMFGAELGTGVRIHGSARIWSPANLVLGDFVLIGRGATIYSMGLIVIDEYAVVSQGAQLCAGTHDVSDPDFQLQTRPVRIGARAWIAADAFVGPGVTVGEGTVLGARGCAMRDLDPWMIYSGNPAQPIRPRHLRGIHDIT